MERHRSWRWRRRRSRRWRGRPVDGAVADGVDGAIGGIGVEVTVGVEEAGGVLIAVGGMGLVAVDADDHHRKAEPRSDVYALGATLHTLLTGRHPDAEYTRLQRAGLDVEATLRALFPTVDSLVPDVPAALTHVMLRATVFAPADRFPQGGALCAFVRGPAGAATISAAAAPAGHGARNQGRSAPPPGPPDAARPRWSLPHRACARPHPLRGLLLPAALWCPPRLSW